MSTEAGNLLIVDDDTVLLNALEQWLGLSGFSTHCAKSADGALAILAEASIDAVLSDLRMPDKDGMALLKDVQERWPEIPVVLLTAHGDVPQAIQALRGGAFDFLIKPHDPDRLVAVLRNACRQSRMSRALRELKEQTSQQDIVGRLILGQSDVMRQLTDQVRALATLPLDVLIYGETGTGKEVIARALHDASPRAKSPFVAINCAAIPAEMIESELFGHESGAFTGAMRMRIGKFEFADGGTLFLDEIESMPLAAQAKLLRVLQERSVERIGGNKRIPIDIRVVSAAKADLKQLARQGGFRDDLYYRIAGYELSVPPLRERDQDILLLFHYFARSVAERANLEPRTLSPSDGLALLDHDWPGNVRELRLVAERFGFGLGLDIAGTAQGGVQQDQSATLDERLDAHERRIILATLSETGGSIGKAVEILGVPRRTLNDRMRRLGIQRLSTGD